MVVRGLYEEQLNDLHKDLLNMGTRVEEAVFQAVKALVHKDEALAKTVIVGDQFINELEVDIEKKCLTLIALQQPVGSDLRRIATTMKISTDLERMGDHAVSIAETALKLKHETYGKPLVDIEKMAELVKQMLHNVLNAYIQLDEIDARRIAKVDDEVDALYDRVFKELTELMSKNQELIYQGTHLLLAAQFIERIGDYSTNICESIVYMITGRIVEMNN